MSYPEKLEAVAAEFYTGQLPVLVNELAESCPGLCWRKSRTEAQAAWEELEARLEQAQITTLKAVSQLLQGATQSGMAYAQKKGLVLALSARPVYCVDELLDEDLFRMAPALCPGEYREAMQRAEQLEETLYNLSTLDERERLEPLLSSWEDLHRLACFLSLYVGYETGIRAVAAVAPDKVDQLNDRTARLRKALGLKKAAAL